MIPILYEDEFIIVINKPVGLASQATKDGENNLLEELGNKYLPVHRLDQRVSGIMLLAKDEKTLAILNEDFKNRHIKKHYRAIVAQKPAKQEAKLIHWLVKNAESSKAKAFNKEVAHSKKAELAYSLIHSSEKYHLLNIILYTGRFHQIRAQLAAIGSPILGDVKYGYKRTMQDGSIFLQSYFLQLKHPSTKQIMEFKITMPELWKKYGFQD